MAHSRAQDDDSLEGFAQQLLAEQDLIVPQLTRQELEARFQALQVAHIVQFLRSRKSESLRALSANRTDLPLVGICVVDADLRMVHADNAALALLSGSDDASQQTSLAAMVVQSDQADLAQWQQAIFGTSQEAAVTVQVRHEGETTVRLLLRGQRMPPLATETSTHASVLLAKQPLPPPNRAPVATICQRLLENYEKEKADLATEIHDGPMQELSSILFMLNALGADAKIQDLVGSLKETATGAIHRLRALTNQLRPPTLYQFGLETAVRSQIDQFQSDHPGLEVALFLSMEKGTLSQTEALVLYRILEHALRNAADHSQAQHILVRVVVEAEEATLDVEDDGVGFAFSEQWREEIHQRQTSLANAIDQVEALDGSLTVHSTPALGTKLRLRLPIGSG